MQQFHKLAWETLEKWSMILQRIEATETVDSEVLDTLEHLVTEFRTQISLLRKILNSSQERKLCRQFIELHAMVVSQRQAPLRSTLFRKIEGVVGVLERVVEVSKAGERNPKFLFNASKPKKVEKDQYAACCERVYPEYRVAYSTCGGVLPRAFGMGKSGGRWGNGRRT